MRLSATTPWSKLCAPEFNLVGARMREARATRLGSIHIPGDARRTHVRRSCHSLLTTRRSRPLSHPASTNPLGLSGLCENPVKAKTL
ncbi:hypothetical protein CRG98_049055, partial [Punica granatum]